MRRGFKSSCVCAGRCCTRRECGDPAVDGYSHVVPSCLEKSRTAGERGRSMIFKLCDPSQSRSLGVTPHCDALHAMCMLTYDCKLYFN